MRKIVRPGYTLVEFLIYIAIVSGLLYVASEVLFSVLSYKLKVQSIESVNQSGQSALDRIVIAIENASAIQSPASGATSSQLVLTMPTTSTNPTIFAVTNGVLRIQEGASASSSLTDDANQLVNVIFTNLTATGTSGTVRTDIAVSSTDVSAYGMHFVTTANIR